MKSLLKKTKKYLFASLIILCLLSIFFYLTVRIVLLLMSELTFVEGVLSLSLLSAESFILLHTIGYLLNTFRVVHKPSILVGIDALELENYPPVAIVVASYKEPLDILKNTLICFYNLSYPNKHLYFLDDTRYDLAWDSEENKLNYRRSIEELCQSLSINLFRANWHGAKAGIINDFLKFLDGKTQEDFEFHAYSKSQSTDRMKYLIVFDADMNPFPDFVEYLVNIMEKNPKLAFTQTPQYYSNFEFNRIARAAGLQQAVFYEYICEGKGMQGAMFCCGTNVIFRIDALLDVEGFDETSVTEDFATSLKLHSKGWQSQYLNKVAAFGMGPEDLGSFFKQQFRWARGTLGVFRGLLRGMLSNFSKFTLNQWWEYFLSSTHYFIGLVFFIMVYFPIIYLFFDIPSYYVEPMLYLMAFLPYISLTMVMFLSTLKQRRYRPKDILQVLLINAVSFPIFMKAAFYALFGIQTKFTITPKNGSTALSFFSLIPQIFTGMACVAAIVWGLARMYYEGEPFYGLLINIFWTFYNFLMISSFLYFNHAEEKAPNEQTS